MPEGDDVLAANRRFYEAFEASDIDAMSDVWVHDDGVVCISAARVAEVLAAALARAEREERVMAGLAAGGTTFELMGIARVNSNEH